VTAALRVYISAGEPSGDAHAAQVVAALKRRAPLSSVDALGGPRLEAAGAHLLDRMEPLTVIGFIEALAKVPAHWRLLKRMERKFQARAYDLVICVDYPGYHLRLAQAAHRANVPVLYYIAPQLWAWGEDRARPFAAVIRRLAVILPFEDAFFRKAGIESVFVGHPLKDRPVPPSREDARRALGLPIDAPILGLFPGSRRVEVKRLWPVFRDAAQEVARRRPGTIAIVAGASTLQYPDPGDVRILRQDPALVFRAADAALCKSGTTTLEAAVADTPLVIAYRLGWLSYRWVRRLVRVPFIGLVNLVAGRQVAPELLQDACTPVGLADAVSPLLDAEGEPARTQREGLRFVRERLGPPGAADRVVDLALELVG
jgi:lipid-A-disaccharide synthase